MKTYDITIVGGGLVGTTLAIALKDSSWRVALIESHVPSQHQQALEDMRSLALSAASQKIFKRLQVWSHLESYLTPIERIHISEAKRLGKTILDAKELDLPPFGAVIPIPYIYQTLQTCLASCTENLTLYRPASVTSVEKKDNHWQLTVNDQKIQTTLLIAADGDRSFIRESLGISTEKKAYEQTAIVTTAAISLPHENTAYERFTAQGVLAILPLQHQRVGIVWTVPDCHLDKIRDNLLEETQKAMGYRVGKFSHLGKIQTHALQEMHASSQTLPGLFLLGNAAHVLHPVAAQGFNLSLRDEDKLSQLLLEYQDLRDPKLSENYLHAREKDQQETERFTHRLVKLFTPQFLPLSLLRSLGLFTFNLINPAKHEFCLRWMGVPL